MKTLQNYSPKIKILSLILTFLVIFYLVPTSVYADGLSNDATPSDTQGNNNDGLENYNSTASHSAGAGGVGSINLATGRMALAIPTLTTTDSLFAFTPTLVYNSSLAGKDVTSEHVDVPFATSYMPKGFKLNIQETIVEKEYCDENNANHTYYSFYDADGTTHHFFSDGSNKYYDDSGLRLTLTFSDGDAMIEDTSKTIRTYSAVNDTAWHLTSVTDKYGNQLIFEFNSTYQPTKVIVKPNGLSEIEMLSLLYENDKLIAVYNNASKDSVIFEYTNGNLSMVRYCYGNDNTTEQNIKDAYADFENAVNIESYASARYNYNIDGYISGVEDIEAKKYIWYLTTGGKTVHITEYSDNFHGQEVSYTYGEGYTDVRSVGNDENLDTADDIITRYIFDQYNRAVSVYSMSADGSVIYGATSGSYEEDTKVKNNLKASAVLHGVNPEDIIESESDSGDYFATIQGGIDTDDTTGVYKQTVFCEENVASLTESNANMEYIISGFGYSNSILQNEHTNFSLGINVYYYQGADAEDEVVTYSFDFAGVEGIWQYVCGKFNCKLESTETVNYDYVSKIEVVCSYYGHPDVGNESAYAHFKDIALTSFKLNNGFDYSYDEYGNLASRENSIYSESYDYDYLHRVTSLESSDGIVCTYWYGTSGENTLHREQYYRDGALVCTTVYVYNKYGLLIAINNLGTTEHDVDNQTPDSFASINTQYSYVTESINFGAISTETDTLGHQTKYFYDDSNGELLAQIDVDSGNGYVYEYSDSGELQAVYPATGTLTEYTKKTNAENVHYEYDPNTHRLSKIITDSSEYSFSYNLYGNSSGITVGNDTLATYEYYPNNGKLKKINYGNGYAETYFYNNLELLEKICYNYSNSEDVDAFVYTYNYDGSLEKIENLLEGTSILFEYDSRGRLVSTTETDSNNSYYENSNRIEYAEDNSISSLTFSIFVDSSNSGSLTPFKTSYSYNNGFLSTEKLEYLSDNHIISYEYDGFERLSRVNRDLGAFDYTTDYTYYSSGANTSYYVSKYVSTVGSSSTTYFYGYDSKGFITSIYQDGDRTTYTYDDIGQLISEYDGKFTTDYSYDDAGNITSIKLTRYSEVQEEIRSYAITPIFPRPIITTTTLSYTDSEWGDLLTSYDGTAITYDEIGNPLSYYNGTAYTFTWEGRKLATAVNGSTTMSFTYNDEGIRTSKTVNNVKHTYQLNGSQIISEQWEDKLIVYIYDASGSPIGMMYRTTSYELEDWDVFWFEKNLQGDIVAVYNDSGTKVATYTYSDAWGNHSVIYKNGGASTGAQYNPFRYRGYYYDTDLGMYYLQSRYYDARICRFINADGALYHSMLGYNLFVYCENNPVNYYDPAGELCADIMDDDGNPLNDWLEYGGVGGGPAGYYGPGTSYYNYQVRMGTAAYDANFGGYHSLGLSSAMINPNYYCVSGAVSVTDSMAVKGGVSSYSSKMTSVRAKGKTGELMSGITKNTSHIKSLTRTANYRIPDGLDNDRKILMEVKNYSGTLSYTAQLKDFVAWSQAEGYQMHLYTNAKLSGPLQQLVNSGAIKVFPLK